jgi:hypothetical protein
MSKFLLLSIICFLFSFSNYLLTKVEVINRVKAIKVEPGHAIKPDDSTFNYQGNKYFLITKETFDKDGNIVDASIAGDVGYSNYTQRDFNKYRSLINDYSLTKFIDVQLTTNNNIIVNGNKIVALEIDRTYKKIYYNLRSKDTLYRIAYK